MHPLRPQPGRLERLDDSGKGGLLFFRRAAVGGIGTGEVGVHPLASHSGSFGRLANKLDGAVRQQADPIHSAVDLDVHGGTQAGGGGRRAGRLQLVQAPHRQAEPRLERFRHAFGRCQSENQDGALDSLAAKLESFFQARRPDPGRAAAPSGARRRRRTVAVATGLDDGHHLRPASIAQAGGVVLDRTQIDVEPRAVQRVGVHPSHVDRRLRAGGGSRRALSGGESIMRPAWNPPAGSR